MLVISEDELTRLGPYADKVLLLILLDKFGDEDSDSQLLARLETCHDPIGPFVASELGLPVDATFADAAKLLSDHWNPDTSIPALNEL